MRRLLLALAGAVVLAALCMTLGLGEFAAAVERASPSRLLLFVTIGVGAFGVYALRWRIVLDALGAPAVPLPVLLLTRISGHAAGTLVPSAHLSGAALRAALLRRRGIAWGPLVLGVAVDRLLETTASAIVGPLYLAFFLRTTGAAPGAFAGALALLAAGLAGIAIAWIYLGRVDRLVAFLVRRSLLPRSADAGDSTRRLASFVRSRGFLLALALSFAVEGMLLAELWTLAWSFGITLSPAVVGGVLFGIGLSHLAPIPGSLGSLEITQIGVIRLAGGAADLGLAVGLLVRLRETLWALVGLAWVYAEGVRSPAAIAGNASRIDVSP